MKVYLYINYYTDENEERNHELTECLEYNLWNGQIERIVAWCAKKDRKAFKKILKKVGKKLAKKAVIVKREERPTYNDYFVATRENPKGLNIIANSDIILDEDDLEKIVNWKWGKAIFALSRWDITEDMVKDEEIDFSEAQLWNHPDSQDTWIGYGAMPVHQDANFSTGIGGCDNKIAFLLDMSVPLYNPAYSIRTYHYHLTDVRNYISKDKVVQRLPPPYKLLPLISLESVGQA